MLYLCYIRYGYCSNTAWIHDWCSIWSIRRIFWKHDFWIRHYMHQICFNPSKIPFGSLKGVSKVRSWGKASVGASQNLAQAQGIEWFSTGVPLQCRSIGFLWSLASSCMRHSFLRGCWRLQPKSFDSCYLLMPLPETQHITKCWSAKWQKNRPKSSVFLKFIQAFLIVWQLIDTTYLLKILYIIVIAVSYPAFYLFIILRFSLSTYCTLYPVSVFVHHRSIGPLHLLPIYFGLDVVAGN